MLKKRLIPLQLLKGGRLVKSIKFGDYRDVGDPVKSSSVYSDQLADELIILNIEPRKGIAPLLEIIDRLAQECFMPLTLGGGIRSFEDAQQLIARGADKVFVNSLCYQDLGVVSRIAAHFGVQAVVAGVDIALNRETMAFELIADGLEKSDSSQCNVALQTHVQRLQQAGVGEIMLQSVDRDGTMTGFNTALVNDVAHWIDLPILVAGGSGHYQHLLEVFEASEASGVVCGSLFNFSDSNPIRARAYLLNHGVPLKTV